MIQYTQLQNGIRIVTETFPHAKSVSLGTYFAVGSAYENEKNNGISHLLEHMVFKGTKRRSAFDIYKELENVGAEVNAETLWDVTCFYAQGLKEHTPLILDVIADMVQHAVMDKTELLREKNVVCQEIKMNLDDGDEILSSHLTKLAFPKQALGRPITGTLKTVRSIKREDLLNYMHTHYTANQLVVSAAGAVDHDEFVEMCEKQFSHLHSYPLKPLQDVVYVGGEYRQNTNKLEQAGIILSFEGLHENDPDFCVQNIIKTILTEGYSSRLYTELREKQGLIYSVESALEHGLQMSILSIYLKTDEPSSSKVMPILLDEISRFSETVTDEEINRAKTILKTSIIMNAESPIACMENNAISIIKHGRVISLMEQFKKLQSITPEQIKHTARKIFTSKPSFCAIGPVNKIMPYSEILSRLDYKNPIAQNHVSPTVLNHITHSRVNS